MAAFARKSAEYLKEQEKILLDSESQRQSQEFRQNLKILDEDKIVNIKEKLVNQPSRLSKSSNNHLYSRYYRAKLKTKLAEMSDDSIISAGESVTDPIKLGIKSY